ncbi:hypothetical protein HQ520_16485 [bacterium]|nr:hypothetical protein [bacterium]
MDISLDLRAHSGWMVDFDPENQEMVLSQPDRGISLQGRLCFHRLDGDMSHEWRISPPAFKGAQRLWLVDPNGDCQGYLSIRQSADRIQLSLAQRPPQIYQGLLRFEATIGFGKNAFACRTRPARASDVVQIASGPADSLLNDSLFDVETDTALRFSGSTARLETYPVSEHTQQFGVILEARSDQSETSEIVIEVLPDYYRSRWVPWYKPLDKGRVPQAPSGWMSWNTYFDQAGEEENLAEARLGARHLKPYGLEIWSIESWQDNSDNLPVSNFHNLTLRSHPEQFPNGMEWLANQIRKLGFKPGIWAVSFGTGDEDFYNSRRDWFLHLPDGKPMHNWNGRFLLDPSQPPAVQFTQHTHWTMAREWGYEFFKTDGISGRGANLSAHFFENPEVRQAFKYDCPEPLREWLEAIRAGIGEESTLLACQGHYTGPEVAFADAARIGADIVHPNHPPKWSNYLDQALVSLSQLFTHGIIWYNDPDTIMAGAYAPTELARLAATVVALPGQVTFFADQLAELPPDRLWLMQRCLPVCDAHPLELYPIYEPRPIWDLKIRRPFGQWDVVSLFNFGPRAHVVQLRFADLGLAPEKEFLLYDFWNGKFLGEFLEEARFEIPAKSNLLLAVHEKLDRPQLLSTDRHLTQGAVELEDLKWDPKRNELSGRSLLVGGETSNLTVHVPKGWKLEKARGRGRIGRNVRIETTQIARDRTVKLRLTASRSRSLDWVISFKA